MNSIIRSSEYLVCNNVGELGTLYVFPFHIYWSVSRHDNDL
jgi:hypothetical protein